MTRDKQLGPLLLCGLGGVFVEIIKDVALRFPPLDVEEARVMLSEIRAAKLLEGYRGSPPCDVEALVEAIVRFGDFVAKTDGQFDAIDINPLIVGPKGCGVRIAGRSDRSGRRSNVIGFRGLRSVDDADLFVCFMQTKARPISPAWL